MPTRAKQPAAQDAGRDASPNGDEARGSTAGITQTSDS